VPDPKATGRAAVHSFRRGALKTVIEMLRDRDPDALASLTDSGLLSRDFVDDPDGGGPLRTAPTLEVVERMLERSIERKPSLIAGLGLSTIQLMANKGEEEEGAAGTTSRLTIAFTDLEGFTRFTERRGDEEASQLLGDHHRTVGPIVRSRGGKIVKRIGDGLLLTFPEPVAGVLACLELVATPPAPLRLRAGIHVGDVVVTRDDVVGHVVNVAARVAESAKGGEVVVTGDVVAEAAADLPHVAFSRPRRKSFKGLAESVPVSKVTVAT
jgi:adenylate cyclase